ncbi:MAG TPA: YqaJ viral recombinase family protein [Thermoanaerobaculia bacterium]|nr:YqaJ viral recombinase family protein [Thermoanaerobaculia bacterium]HQN09883.1 YqaJ viral recombinase family protein [Thermoanaerobaculia bacterium]HQP89103.1 YqaJ viral recombinase family protein [Thermoanaerobaculia bacterium]
MEGTNRITLAEPSREEWLEERKTGLGGSDAAAVLGLNPWASPLSVYLEKLGLAEPKEESRPMRLGKRMEPVILEEYLRETGGRASLNARVYRHPEFPEILGTPDAFREDEPVGVELKWIGDRSASQWGESGTDDIPDYYYTQVAVYMAVTNREAWDLAAIIGGRDLRIYRIERNLALEEELLGRLRAFWRDHVLAQVPPEVDGSADARRWIDARFPRQRAALRPATAQEEAWARELAVVREAKVRIEGDEERLRNLLTASIGEAEGIEGAFGRITWKAGKDSVRTDWKGLVAALNPTAEIVSRFVSIEPASRRFLPSFKKEN